MVIYEAPWKLHDMAGRFANGWMLSGIGQFHSGLPYTMRVTGSLPEESKTSSGVGIPRRGLRPQHERLTAATTASMAWAATAHYNIGRNTFRYPDTWKADLRLGKRFDLGEMRQLEIAGRELQSLQP